MEQRECRARWISSLRRSSQAAALEIILVDDQ
jgi:hypothetical protein